MLPATERLAGWLGRRPKRAIGNEHIIITGTGRAGTTLLVQILTHLGFDTGFAKSRSLEAVDSISHAGLEHSLRAADLPYVIKSPWFVDELDDVLQTRARVIRAAIVPIRDLVEAADSRRRVWRTAADRQLDPRNQPGTLWKTEDPAAQEGVLAIQFHNIVNTLVSHEIPIYFVSFPRFAKDAAYLYRSLCPIFAAHGVSRRRLLAEHRRVVKPDLVHDFGGESAGAAPTDQPRSAPGQ
jgi:hypothetical protein